MSWEDCCGWRIGNSLERDGGPWFEETEVKDEKSQSE